MKRLLWPVRCALLLLSTQVLAQETVKFGISPWTTPQLLQAWAKPVEQAMEKQTGISYQVASSANLQKYLLDAIQGEFEILQTPMHLGLYLIRHHRFKPVMFARAKLKLLVLTRQNLPIDYLAQLKGTSMAVSGPVAIATLVAKEAIVNQLFEVELVPEKNHWQALEALQKKRTQSALVVDYLFRRLSQPLKSRLKVLYEFPITLDGLLLMPPNSSNEVRADIAEGLMEFTPYKSSLLTQFEKVTEQELAQWFEVMNAYVALVHQHMNQVYFSKKSLH